MTRERKRALVIGSGLGGLAAAVRLGAKGYAVTVLERQSSPGGKAVQFEMDGYRFDAGPTVVTAPHLLEELWELNGERMADHVQLRHVDPMYLVRFADGSRFNYFSDHDALRREVESLAPEDLAGYDRYIALSEKIFDLGFARLLDVPFMSWGSMLKIVPQMIRLQSYRRVYGVVAKYVKNDKLRQILSFHTLLVGGNPMSTTAIYCLISAVEQAWGVTYPVGGMGAMVRGLVELIGRQGNELRLNAEVEAIELKNRTACGLRLTGGERLSADLVVSNADAAWTYRQLLPETARRRWKNKRIDSRKYSMSCFLWYFGTDRRYDEVAQHSILLGPRYKGLLDDIFSNKILADDFSLYLHRPTATDSSMAPPGCDSFYVLSPVPNLEADIDWQTQAEPYRQRICRFLSDNLMPELEGHVVCSRVTTPEDFLRRNLAFRGAAFGLQPTLLQSAYFRPHNRSEDIANLYLVGASTHPGAGVPGVVASAKVLERLIPRADS